MSSNATNPALARLSSSDWLAIAAAHLVAARDLTSGPRMRRDRGESHPIEDFLFDYYPYPFALIEHWHPGLGTSLEVADLEEVPQRFLGKYYSLADGAVFLDSSQLPEKARTRLAWIRDLLIATENRPPNFACHGLHEWAMVYQAKDIRHSEVAPLRLGQEATDRVVESRSIHCTHHDAFRFFAEGARSFNRCKPTMETRHLNEQPGCVHANMDIYKWAAKAMPWIGSDLLLRAFRLASKLRILDMRASPYDLSEWGLEPIKIETVEGRRDYEKHQRNLAIQASKLRRELIGRISLIIESTRD